MTKLMNLDLQNAEILDKKGMKEVTGGSSQIYCQFDADCMDGGVCIDGMCSLTNCSTTCADGTFLQITDCIGDCIATPTSVKCVSTTRNLIYECK